MVIAIIGTRREQMEILLFKCVAPFAVAALRSEPIGRMSHTKLSWLRGWAGLCGSCVRAAV